MESQPAEGVITDDGVLHLLAVTQLMTGHSP